MTGCWTQETCAAVDRRHSCVLHVHCDRELMTARTLIQAMTGICAQRACSRPLGTHLSMRSCSEAGFSAPHHTPRGARAAFPCSN